MTDVPLPHRGDAIRIDLSINGAVTRLAVAPWTSLLDMLREQETVALLKNAPPGPEAFGKFANALMKGAVPQSQKGFKISLARRAIVRALRQAASGTPQPVADKIIV